MLEADLEIGGMFDQNYAIGAGADIGIMIRITNSWKVILSAKVIRYALGDRFTENQEKITQMFTLNGSNSLGLTGSRESRWNREKTNVALIWLYYF